MASFWSAPVFDHPREMIVFWYFISKICPSQYCSIPLLLISLICTNIYHCHTVTGMLWLETGADQKPGHRQFNALMSIRRIVREIGGVRKEQKHNSKILFFCLHNHGFRLGRLVRKPSNSICFIWWNLNAIWCNCPCYLPQCCGGILKPRCLIC